MTKTSMALHDTPPRVYVHIGCSHDGDVFEFHLVTCLHFICYLLSLASSVSGAAL